MRSQPSHRLRRFGNVLPAVVVPDPATRPWEHSLDREKKPHLSRFEDAALRIDQGDAFAVECEARSELVRCQVIMRFGKPSDLLESCETYELVPIAVA